MLVLLEMGAVSWQSSTHAKVIGKELEGGLLKARHGRRGLTGTEETKTHVCISALLGTGLSAELC